MSTDSITIPPETARHVLWHYGAAGGYQPGSFTQRLMEAIDAADMDNVEILRTAYPVLVTAMDMAGNDLDGLSRLLVIATQPHCDDCGDTDGPFAERVEGLVCEGCIQKRSL